MLQRYALSRFYVIRKKVALVVSTKLFIHSCCHGYTPPNRYSITVFPSHQVTSFVTLLTVTKAIRSGAAHTCYILAAVAVCGNFPSTPCPLDVPMAVRTVSITVRIFAASWSLTDVLLLSLSSWLSCAVPNSTCRLLLHSVITP